MKATVVRYRTKPDRADENQALIERVFAELDERAPDGLGYASFRLEDGVSFVHVAFHPDEGANPLTEIAAFQTFTGNIADRCEEAPVAMSATIVGAYKLMT
jgi:hypothetical protein